MCRMNGAELHFFCGAIEAVLHLLFDHQSLCSFRTRNSLVEVACDLRVYLTDLVIQSHQLHLEHLRHHCDDRYNKKHPECQLRIGLKHDENRTDDVRNIPNAIHETPGYQRTDTVGVTHNSRMNISYTILIKIRKCQGLQMIEAFTLHIASHIHLDLTCLVGRNSVGDNLKCQHTQVHPDECIHCIQGLFCNKMIDGIFLKQRKDNVHQTACKTKGDHPENNPAVRF